MSLRLTKDDLKDLLYAIEDVTADWMMLGVYLKLPGHKLKEIESQYKHDVGRCKMEMLTLWLNIDVAATWELLASALEQGLKMIVPAANIRRRIAEYTGFASGGLCRLGMLRDRSGGSVLLAASSCWTTEEELAAPTQLHKSISSGIRKHSFDYYQSAPRVPSLLHSPTKPPTRFLTSTSPHHASARSFSTPSAAADQSSHPARPSFAFPNASPTSAGHSTASAGPLTFFPDPLSTSAGSPTRPSPISVSRSATDLLTSPSATPLADHLPMAAGSSSTPTRPSPISVGQSTTNLLTASPDRLPTPVSPSNRQLKKRKQQGLKNDVTAAENQRIVCLKRHFAYLVKAVLDILQDEERTDVYQVQVLVQQLPISCSDPQRVLQPQERLKIQRARSIAQIFSILSGKYISYENFGLLESIAQTFCDRRSKPLLDAYTREYHDPESTGHPPLQQIFTEEGRKLAKMKENFANLVVRIICILEKEGLNLQQLSAYIRTAKRLRQQDAEMLKHPKSVSHIFSIIIGYINYDSYHLLWCVVKQFGNDRAKHMMRKYKQKLSGAVPHEQLGRTRSGRSSDEDADSSSDGRSSGPTNCTLTSHSSRNHSHSSPDLMHSREGGTHDCSEEHQQHCSQEATSNASQKTTSAVDALSAATVSNSSCPHTDDTHSAVTVSTSSHPSTTDDRVATVSTSSHMLADDTHSAASVSTDSHPLPPTDRSVSSSLALSQRVCYSDKLSNSSYLLAVTNGRDSSTATSSSLSTSTANASPQVQTVVVKTFFAPWTKGQIHVRPRQKVKVNTRNLVRAQFDKMPFVDVLTESGREGKVPVSVLDVGSLPVMCSRMPVDQPSPCNSCLVPMPVQQSQVNPSASSSYAHSSKHNETHSHSLKVAGLATNTTTTSDVSIARRRVTGSPNVNSTSLSSRPVPPSNNLSRPQSFPVAVSSYAEPSFLQDSPQSAVAKLPKKSRAHRALSRIKRFFKSSSGNALECDEASVIKSSYTLSPIELSYTLSPIELFGELNSQPVTV